jgi:hypothetical protein
MTTAQPGELLQRLFERLQRLDVQVVGGLVEQDQVAGLGEGLGQVHAVALTAREQSHLLLLVAALEVEGADVGARVDLALADHHHVQAAGDFLPDGFLGVEVVPALVHEGELHRIAQPDLALVGLLHAGDQLEQGRLAGAVGPDHADDAVGRQLERQALEQDLFAVLLLQVLHLEHQVAEPRARRDLDMGVGLGGAGVLLLAHHLVIGRQAGLGLGLAGLGARAHPLEFAGQGALARLALALLLHDALGLLLQPAGVVALVGMPLPRSSSSVHLVTWSRK